MFLCFRKRPFIRLYDLCYPDLEQAKVLHHVNGVIGSANGRNTDSKEALYCRLKVRFSQDEQVRAMIGDPDFDRFWVIVARRH